MTHRKYCKGVLSLTAICTAVMALRLCDAEASEFIECSANQIGGDSVVFQVPERDSQRLKQPTTAQGAKEAIEYYINRHTRFGITCSIKRDLALAIPPDSCAPINPRLPFSEACYLESKLGYFIVVKDYFETYNVTFVRWD